MSRTATRIVFGLYTSQIKADATFNANLSHANSNINDLKYGGAITARSFGTLEPDFFLLDGTYLMGGNWVVHEGYISSNLSNNVGTYVSAPIIDVTFGDPRDIDELHIAFDVHSGDHIVHLLLEAYDAEDNLLNSLDIPNNNTASLDLVVNWVNVKYFYLYMYSSSKPYRYARVTGIEFGPIITFEGDQIIAASVIEEVSPSGSELPVCTFDFTVRSTTADFNIVDPSPLYSSLRERQVVDVYETLEDRELYIGQFYLDKWEAISSNTMKFHCVDAVGVLEGIDYMGGMFTGMYNPTSVINEIQALTGIAILTEGIVGNISIRGWMPAMNCREALQWLALASSIQFQATRYGPIKYAQPMYKNAIASEYILTAAEKSAESTILLKPLVTAVEVTSHDYVANATVSTIFDGDLIVGEHTIIFTAPFHDLILTGATLVSSNVNHVKITVDVAGTVTLTGQGYTVVQSSATYGYGYGTLVLAEGVKPNVLKIDDVTIILPQAALQVAVYVWLYYANRYVYKFRMYGYPVEINKWATVSVQDTTKQIRGVVEAMTTDLLGYNTNVEIVGVVI